MNHQSTETKGATWFRVRTWAAALAVLVLISAGILYLWKAPFYKLAQDWQKAQATKNISAMEALYCWDGVDAETHQRMRLLLLQEFEYPLKRVQVGRWHDDFEDGRMCPNLKPAAQLNVTFDNAERFQVSFIIGRTADGACKLAIMVPKP